MKYLIKANEYFLIYVDVVNVSLKFFAFFKSIGKETAFTGYGLVGLEFAEPSAISSSDYSRNILGSLRNITRKLLSDVLRL